MRSFSLIFDQNGWWVDRLCVSRALVSVHNGHLMLPAFNAVNKINTNFSFIQALTHTCFRVKAG